MILLLLFVLGTLIGSFLNVCIYRLPRRESVVFPPSHCFNCNHQLSHFDLLPLVSQLWLRGKCRYCGIKYSWRYFGIECLTGFLFVLVGLQSGNLSDTSFLAAWTGDLARLLRDLTFMACLVVILWVDYDTRYVQLESTLLLGLSAVAFQAWQLYQGQNILTDGKNFANLLPAPIPESLLAAVVTATALWVTREFFTQIYRREALGFGDVIIVAAIAMHLGWNMTLFTFFFLAVIIGAFVGVILETPRAIRVYRWGKTRAARYGTPSRARALARHAFRKGTMPFGPSLAIGAVAALLFGAQINAFYANLVAPPEMTPILGVLASNTR